MEAGGMLNISFYMEQSKANKWMLSNVVINNINFGLTFRKQFAVMMEQNRNDIDAAISAWRDSLAKSLNDYSCSFFCSLRIRIHHMNSDFFWFFCLVLSVWIKILENKWFFIQS